MGRAKQLEQDVSSRDSLNIVHLGMTFLTLAAHRTARVIFLRFSMNKEL